MSTSGAVMVAMLGKTLHYSELHTALFSSTVSTNFHLWRCPGGDEDVLGTNGISWLICVCSMAPDLVPVVGPAPDRCRC